MPGVDCSVECPRHHDRQRGGAECGQTQQFVAAGDVPMQEGACQHIQGDQGQDDQIAHRPDAIELTASWQWHRVDKVVPAGIAIANKSLFSVRSSRFVNENDALNITSPCKGNYPTKRGGKGSVPLEAWIAFSAGKKNKKSRLF